MMWTQDPASVLAARAQPKATLQFGEKPLGVSARWAWSTEPTHSTLCPRSHLLQKLSHLGQGGGAGTLRFLVSLFSWGSEFQGSKIVPEVG